MSLGSAFCGLWALGPSFFAATGHGAEWTFLFHSTLGIFPAGIIHGFFGITTGAFTGKLAAFLVARVKTFPAIAFLTLVISAAILFLCYIPIAALEYVLAGGSGYGKGVPRVFMCLFESLYFRAFSWMQEAGISLIPFGTYSPVVLWITGALIVFGVAIRQLRKRLTIT